METIQNNNLSAKRKMFLFFCLSFFSLNMFPFTLILDNLCEGLLNFTASAFFGFKEVLNTDSTGSGDKARHYIELFISFCLSIIITIIFIFVFRKRNNFDKLNYWFNVYIRYYMGTMMLIYGLSKVFKSQFLSLGLDQLLEPYGQSSPMGLAWNFMGHSDLYCFFAGFAEVIAGFFLFFRRTVLFGSILVAGVMFNVMMMNYGFDIPVKIFSTQLVLMALYLAAPDTKRLFDFFFLNKDVKASYHYANDFSNKRNRMAKNIAKSIFLALFIVLCVLQSFLNNNQDYKKHPLRGIYLVKTFIRNNNSVPPLASDTLRWKLMVINYPTRATFYLYNDSLKRMLLQADTVLKKIKMTRKGNDKTIYSFDYSLKGNELTFKGYSDKDTLEITFQRFNESHFRLVSRGFHWINEVPYNR